MANLIVSYDLNGPRPSHEEMDQHLEKLGVWRGRVLETVWYVAGNENAATLFAHVKSILGPEDRLLVVEASEGSWENLLVEDESLLDAWQRNR